MERAAALQAVSEEAGSAGHAAERSWPVPETDAPSAPPDAAAIRRFLSAVHQALDIPAPARAHDRMAYLTLLAQRARLARVSIGRLIADPCSDALDYASESDELLHQLADLPVRIYRHHREEA
jgi:hypothetical protein